MIEKYNRLIRSAKRFFGKTGYKKAVVGLSGGVDSALCVRLLVDALGSKNVTALIMPEAGVSLRDNIEDAVAFCKKLKIKFHLITINGFVKEFDKVKWKRSKLAKSNAKARIRAALLYHYANACDALVCGTSNKTELMLGYFTKYGDGAVDFELIGSLLKSEVYMLAAHLELPQQILENVPSAELYQGQSDEDELGARYEEIDEILMQISKKSIKGDKRLISRIQERIERNRHKLNTPPVI